MTQFKADGNEVLDVSLDEYGYIKEQHLVCMCYGTPGLGDTGADVAEEIAEILNKVFSAVAIICETGLTTMTPTAEEANHEC